MVPVLLFAYDRLILAREVERTRDRAIAGEALCALCGGRAWLTWRCVTTCCAASGIPKRSRGWTWCSPCRRSSGSMCTRWCGRWDCRCSTTRPWCTRRGSANFVLPLSGVAAAVAALVWASRRSRAVAVRLVVAGRADGAADRRHLRLHCRKTWCTTVIFTCRRWASPSCWRGRFAASSQAGEELFGAPQGADDRHPGAGLRAGRRYRHAERLLDERPDPLRARSPGRAQERGRDQSSGK